MTKHFLLFSFLLVTISCAQEQNQNVNSLFEELHKDNKFNGNVLILQDHKVIYKNSLGYARGDKSKELTEENLFQLGSIYKEFPAIAIMQLKEKGLLSLNDTLSHFIPELPNWANQITLKHLLQYSSGLPLINWQNLFNDSRGVSLDLVLNQLPQIQTLNFQPGTDYLYSNFNPFLLLQIIESVSKLDFEQYLEKNIFSPFNIKGITVTNSYPYNSSNNKFAYPFDENFKEDDMEYKLPTICASTEGMYQWFNLLDNFKIISKESVQFLSEEAKQGDNIQAPLGRGDWKNGDLDLHLHHGSTGNYECLVRNYKTEKIQIILLTNQKHRNLHDIADKVYEMINQIKK